MTSIPIVLLWDDHESCAWWSRDGVDSAMRLAIKIAEDYFGKVERLESPEGLVLCIDKRNKR